MEDNKTYELMTMLYNKFTEFENEFKELKTEVKDFKQQTNNNFARIENYLVPKIEASLDGYSMLYAKVEEHDKRFDRIEEKLENNQVEIGIIKSSRKEIV